MKPPSDTPPLRRSIALLLIVVAVASVGGRLLAVGRVYEPWFYRAAEDPTSPYDPWPANRPQPTPTFGSNDRSRWDTVRALVDDGTYVIGRRDPTVVLATAVGPVGATDPLQAASLAMAGYQLRINSDTGIITEDGWTTIDKVLHPTRLEFYSSKPPLLATLLAGEYWLLKHTLGWEIADPEGRFLVVRTILFTVNVLPLFVYLVLLARLLERLGRTDWGRLFVLTAACFATFVTPFCVTLNNHTVAAWTTLFALYPVLLLWAEPWPGWRGTALTLLAGMFAGLTVSFELPAAIFAAALFVALLLRAPARALLAYLPAAAVPVAALLLTNYLAIGTLSPAYAKTDSVWYRYEGSHWQTGRFRRPVSIDWAKEEEGPAVYAFHFLVGHHGAFSLSPVFLLALVGMGLAFRRAPDRSLPADEPAATASTDGTAAAKGRAPPAGQGMIALVTLVVSVVVIAFYLVKTNNYGGWTSGPRWLIWLTPLWLLTMAPVADRLAACRWGRGLAYVLLAVSVLSASYPAWNPWRHSWLYNFMESRGWLPYW